jgi:pyruvate/2-oxoglutarate dehydrogenase complex dihydrolipoamide dehydrogenase (E3) component
MTPERVEIRLGQWRGRQAPGLHMAQAGHPVAVVERRWIGGSCPNINCLPSKKEI